MLSWRKTKEWINENAPMLAKLYENKYVGMAYDRFGSLPPNQQKQVMIGSAAAVMGVIVLVLLTSYLSLWSYSGKSEKAGEMVNMLIQYQKSRRSQESQLQVLERNNILASDNALKDYIVKTATNANISQRMVHAEEKREGGEVDDPKAPQEVKLKQATVKLERVNLNQLRIFLQNLEFGNYSLSVSSIKVTNDDKIRGYMNVEIGVVAYLFSTEEEGGA